MAGDECDKPLETYFSFGSHANYYVENGMGRYIMVEEAKAIVAKSEAEGLVDAMELMQKPGHQLYEPPGTGAETYIRIMQERGKIY